MEFPIYRKLDNGLSFYKIKSLKVFQEKQIIGSKCFLHTIEAHQYPEMLRIQDMIDLQAPYVSCTAEDYELAK